MINKSVRTFSGFLEMLNESEKQPIQIFKVFTFDEMLDLGTPRWIPCRKFEREYFESMNKLGNFYIIQDIAKKPLFLLHPSTNFLIDFDNHTYEGSAYYEKIQEYPEILTEIQDSL